MESTFSYMNSSLGFGNNSFICMHHAIFGELPIHLRSEMSDGVC